MKKNYNKEIEKIDEKLEKGFYGFWVKKYRVSFLLIFLIIIAGLFSLFTIPKESAPDIKLGIISIRTLYPGVNPKDIDSLITDEIEKEIKDIDGIKKITSNSVVGMSSIKVDLESGVESRDVLTDIKDAVDKVSLPEDSEIPEVIEISTNNELMFEVLLYGKQENFSYFDLVSKAQIIKSHLEGKNQISSIELGGIKLKSGISPDFDDYEIKVFFDKEKIEQLGLTIKQISNIIKSYNKNTPIGDFSIGNLNYDFRFDGELSGIEELKNIIIRGENGSNIKLGDISTIKKEYKKEKIQKLGFKNNKGYNYVSLVFNKTQGVNVFRVSGKAKKSLEKFIKSNPTFEGLNIFYTKDMTDLIIQDYKNLSKTAIQTLFLVFFTILIFVGFRESLIVSMLLPLSFLVTFIVLDFIGFSLNFLTNFSLVLTLGIAIDTMIVIVEGASEKIQSGYNKKASILLAVKDYKSPLISGTMTTLVAFLPLIFLPGVMGKFFSYIPITVFSTLLAALILSLTVSSALFVKFVKNSKYYIKNEKLEETFSNSQAEYLKNHRIGKEEISNKKTGFRNKFLTKMSKRYSKMLEKVIISRKKRIILIFSPIIFLILTFIFLVPKIGFTLFPYTDNAMIEATIKAKEGVKEEFLKKYLNQIDEVLYKLPELKVYHSKINGNNINVYIELLDTNFRKSKNMKTAFEIEKIISDDLRKLESEGFGVSIEVKKDGPPSTKAVGIKLIANNVKKYESLKKTAEIFKSHFKTLDGVKNVTTTSTQTPGQFVFEFNKEKLGELGLNPNDILQEIYFYKNGIKSSTIKSEYEDNYIVLKIKQFDENLSPEDINNLIINTKIGKIRVGDFVKYKFTKSVSSISREDGKISITVEGDVLFGILPSEIQPKLVEFAKNYNYPDGITYKAGGENQENSDLIISTIRSFFIVVFLIFSILVFQFNSYLQPLIVIYSVVLALLGVNIGLFLTGNPYSMTFMIGFIALTGVVVNDAIILIDRINKNLEKGIDNFHCVISAGKNRLQPIMVTTLTTVFGVLPLALQDEFWAGLGFTIVFGLIAGSSMTLFVIPSLYYEIFLRKKKNFKTDEIKDIE